MDKNDDLLEKGWTLNKAKLMPDYRVKMQSISVREYLKRLLLVDLFENNTEMEVGRESKKTALQM